MYHAVTYCVELLKRLQRTVLSVCEHVEDELHTHCVLRNVLLDGLLAISNVKLDECARKAYLLYATLCKNITALSVEELVLDGTAAAVQN